MNLNRIFSVRGFLIALTIVSISLAACGWDDSASDTVMQENTGSDGPSGPAGAGGQTGDSAAARARATPAPQPTGTPAPRPPALDFDLSDGEEGSAKGLSSVLENQVAQAAQERIIVRSVSMAIEVMSVSDSIQEIGQIATLNGGWVVRTQHVESHRGFIDIRVPADRLDDTLLSARQISENVKSEISTSQDFTEEFTDTSARITTLQDTVDALRVLFDRAEEIEDALNIQREITSIQSDLEALQARINFLSESAAFSLISVEVLALPQTVAVDAGQDMLAAAGGAVRFRAKFQRPEGIDDFRIEWDFGDGTAPQATTRVAPFDTDGTVISAPIVHYFDDDTDSPYIVQVTVTGSGESGAIEGEDVVVMTVTRVPPIDVFAGSDVATEPGKTVKFNGNFTRPDGVTDLVYTWDFGDGSTPLRVEAAAGETVATAEHSYANYRPQDYVVILTVSGETEAGSTEGTGTMRVSVEESESLDTGSFTPRETGKDAFEILSVAAKGIGNALVFIAVLSPIWIILAIVAFVIYRMNKRNSAKRVAMRVSPPQQPPTETPAT